jgi:hypothetical protein
MATLKQKFNTDLVLGYIAEDASCREILSDADFIQLLDEKGRSTIDTITLHCWGKSVAFHVIDDGGTGSAPAGTVTSTLKKSRPPSAASSRASSQSTRRSAVQSFGALDRGIPKGHELDVSGVAYSQEQLRALFNALDTDHSGFLTKEEFAEYFHSTHDSMGIPGWETKMDKMLDSLPEFEDGKLTFEEFSVVMLKIAQW